MKLRMGGHPVLGVFCRTFIRGFVGAPPSSAVPLSSVQLALRPPSIVPSVTSPISPVVRRRLLLPVGVAPLLFPPTVLLSFAVAAFQRLPAGASLRLDFSGVLQIPAVSVVTGISRCFSRSLTSVTSLAGLSGLPIISNFGVVVAIVAIPLPFAAALCL